MAAHAAVVAAERAQGFGFTGALASDTDDRVPALQAADVISWAAKKTNLHGVLPEGFEPLQDLLVEDRWPLHRHIHLPIEAIRMISGPINRWLQRKGEMPQLSDLIRM